SAVVGMGSSVFHPESARVARFASGGRHGLAQSLFPVGGQVGSATRPLLAAFVVLPYGAKSPARLSPQAGGGAVSPLPARPRRWSAHRRPAAGAGRARAAVLPVTLSSWQVRRAIAVLLTLIFSKYFYLSSLTSFYTFYLIHKFAVSVQTAQLLLFVFLAAAAAG